MLRYPALDALTIPLTLLESKANLRFDTSVARRITPAEPRIPGAPERLAEEWRTEIPNRYTEVCMVEKILHLQREGHFICRLRGWARNDSLPPGLER